MMSIEHEYMTVSCYASTLLMVRYYNIRAYRSISSDSAH